MIMRKQTREMIDAINLVLVSDKNNFEYTKEKKLTIP